jgi:hypothetical protein
MILPPNMTRGRFGLTGETPAFEPHPDSVFAVDLQTSTVPLRDMGDSASVPIFTRYSATSVMDYDGLVISAAYLEAAIFGSRRISNGNYTTRSRDNNRRINPSLLEKGMWLGEARTNIATYSQAFASWTQVATVTDSDATTAPDGTTTADKLSDDGSTNGRHYVRQILGPEDGNDYTTSVYAKAGTTDWIGVGLNIGGGVSHGAFFNLGDGTLGTVSAPAYAQMEDAGDGWYRCSVTEPWGGGSDRCDVVLADSDEGSSYDASSTSYYAYVWGADHSKGHGSAPHITNTGTGSTTRAYDRLSYHYSNYADEMTIFGTFYLPHGEKTGVLRTMFKFSDKGANRYCQLQIASSSGVFQQSRYNSGLDYMSEPGVSIPEAGFYKYACTFSLTGADCRTYINGVRLNTGGAHPNTTSMEFGMDNFVIGRIENQTSFFNGYLGTLEVAHRVFSAAEQEAWTK